MRVHPKGTSSPALQAVREEATVITKVEKRALKPLTNFVQEQYAATQAMKFRKIGVRRPDARTARLVTQAARATKELSTTARKQWSSQGRRG